MHFTGNIFFEPTLNRLHGGFAGRDEFCAKYGYNPLRPICLWLPNRGDVQNAAYGEVVRAAAAAGVNLAVKLHPWEYAFKKHGRDVWGLGRTSNEIWGVRAVDEPDSSWAYRYCDLAVMRCSATCLETPFWNKPNVILPAADHLGLFVPQANLVRRCSVILQDLAGLADVLAAAPPHFAPEDYAAARASVRLDTGRDAYAQTVAVLTGILAGTCPGHPADRTSLGRLYDALIPPDMAAGLAFFRRLHFVAGRIWRRLTA